MKKLNYNLIFFFFFIVINGCSTIKKELIPTYNKGGYIIKVIETKSKTNTENLKITGKVFDITTGKTLSNAELLIGCNKIKTSTQGEYTFETTNPKANLLYIKTTFIGYKSIQTNFIDFPNKNQLQIDFYLSEDDTPLINCEGK